MPGCFITFEGGEGAGKSTQIRMLADALARAGHKTIVTREPGGTPEAELIRELLVKPGRSFTPLGEALLYYSARQEHLAQCIRPALDAGGIVLCDRFDDSTQAYQVVASGLDPAALRTLRCLVVADTIPNLTIILDLAPQIGLARATTRAKERGESTSRYERMDIAFHNRLRDAFHAIARAEPDRCAIVDASGSMEAVHASIRAILALRLPKLGIAR